MVLKQSNVVFLPEEHRYFLGDKELQGITGMLSRQLFPHKYKSVPKTVLDKAASRGTKIHSDLHRYDLFGKADTQEMEWYAGLLEREQLDVLDNEYLVTDGIYFASAIDKVMMRGNDWILADVKTTYKLDRDYVSWQLSIYKYLFELMNPGIEIKHLYAIWVKDGAELVEVEIRPEEDVVELLDCERNGVQYQAVSVSKTDKALRLIKEISDIATRIEELKSLKSDYDAKIEALFNSLNVDRWETDLFTITRTNAYTKSQFDSKKFKEDHPELYGQYKKEISIKSSIKTKLK